MSKLSNDNVILYAVSYTADESDNHTIECGYHTCTFVKYFKGAVDAQHFYGECTSPQKELHYLNKESIDETMIPEEDTIDQDNYFINLFN